MGSAQNNWRDVALKGWLVGALWGAVGATIEASVSNRWFHTELALTLATIELILNYALYVGLVAIALHVLINLVAAGRRATIDGLRATESLVAAAVVVLGLLNFLMVGPLAGRSIRSVIVLSAIVASVVVIIVAARGIYLVPQAWRWRMRAAAFLLVVAGVLWPLLMGTYSGVLSRTGEKAAAGSYKNVLLIVTDTQRRDYLGCYGSDWRASPAADSLAERGTLFTNHIAQSTWTLPSMASLMTGLFPSSHGAVRSNHAVSRDAVTLAESLRDAGFNTGAFTENLHIVPRNGFARGFDKFWVHWHPWVYGHTLLHRVRSLAKLPAIELTRKNAFPETFADPHEVYWDARVTANRCLDWLDRLDDSPFFAYLHFMGPHGPYGPPEFLLDRDPPERSIVDHPRPMGDAYPLGEAGIAVSEEELKTIETLYAADVMYTEREMQRVLDWLEASGRADQTLIVFTSDHGEEFFDHGAWNHGSTAFDEVLRVPMIIVDPDSKGARRKVQDCTRQIDVVPTVLDVVGLPIPDQVQGRSLKPLLHGGTMAPLPAYTEVYPARPHDSAIFSLVKDNFKIITVRVEDRSAALLFDLDTDPGELRNLSTEQPDIFQQMLEDMDVWDQVARRYSPKSTSAPMDPETMKILKSLGYVN